MYRTPSHVRITGEHTFGTPARSNFGWSKGHVESRELLIQHLKREMSELKQNAKSYNELATKLSNVEHRTVLLTDEKNKIEEELKRRDESQSLSILTLTSELNAIKERQNQRLTDTSELRRAFDLLQISLSKRENETLSIEQTLKNEVENFESLLNSKNLVENDSQSVTKETLAIEEKQRLVDEDINSMNGQIKKQKKQVNDIRERMGETDLKIKEAKTACYDIEEDIKNAENSLKTKDQQLDELNQSINNLDNEVNVVAKEEECLKDDILQANEELKEANDFNAEMLRRKNMLLREKQTAEENLSEVECDLNKQKMELSNISGTKIASENEVKHLQSIYSKMRVENAKLLEELYEMTRVDEKVRKMLSREERTREVKDAADKEMKTAAHLIKEAY